MINNKQEFLEKYPNMFVCGLSGSGKDTLINIYSSKLPFVKVRLAETIKRMVTELNGISFDELEELKRIKPELRSQHNEFDILMRPFTKNPNKQSSIDRLKMLILRKTMDFTNPVLDSIKEDLVNNPMFVIDVRSDVEIQLLIEAGYHGIFLTRKTDEFRNKTHETEADPLADGLIEKLCIDGYSNQITIIDNNSTEPNILAEALKYKYGIELMHIGRASKEIFEDTVESLFRYQNNNFSFNIINNNKSFRNDNK